MLSCGTPQGLVTSAHVLSRDESVQEANLIVFLGSRYHGGSNPTQFLPEFCWSSLRGLLVPPNPFFFVFVFVFC